MMGDGNPFAEFAFVPPTETSPASRGGKRKPTVPACAAAGHDTPCKTRKAPKKAEIGAPPFHSAKFRGWLPVYDYGCHGQILPVLAGTPGGWRERWSGICETCFQQGCQCAHFPELPLRMLIIGHNPSVRTWEVGVAYGNASNRFWPLMRSAGILPRGWREDDHLHVINNAMPFELGIGITDIGCLPGSDAAEFGRDIMALWRTDLYKRIRAHVHRVTLCCNAMTPVAKEGGRQAGEEAGGLGQEFAHPRIVAFTGKRHFSLLFDPPLKGLSFGPQQARPQGWPFPVRGCAHARSCLCLACVRLPAPRVRPACSCVRRRCVRACVCASALAAGNAHASDAIIFDGETLWLASIR